MTNPLEELFGRERLEQIREEVIKVAKKDGRKWLEQHGEALAESGIEFVRDSVTFAADGRLTHLALNPKYHAEWMALRRSTTEKLDGVLGRRVELYQALNSAKQIVLEALKVAILPLLAAL